MESEMHVDVQGPQRWGIILAGGDGLRLRSLTRRISCDDRPKQFCPILRGETMLAATRRRLALSVPSTRTIVAVTETHEHFYAPLLTDVPSSRLLVQPANRGTAPAILYSLLRIVGAAPTAAIAIQPSDHFVSDDVAFMRHVDLAFRAVEARPQLVVLLGVTPEDAEPQYGWIDPGDLIPDAAPARWARGFWEKPSPALAARLLARGALWNTFVVVARMPALALLIQRAVPALFRAFMPMLSSLDTRREEAAVRRVYACLGSVDFSRCVLAHPSHALAVLPVRGVHWSDWGSPERVVASIRRDGIAEDGVTGWGSRSREAR